MSRSGVEHAIARFWSELERQGIGSDELERVASDEIRAVRRRVLQALGYDAREARSHGWTVRGFTDAVERLGLDPRDFGVLSVRRKGGNPRGRSRIGSDRWAGVFTRALRGEDAPH